MFISIQRVEMVAEVEETVETVISTTSEVVTVDLAAVAEEADSEETVIVLLDETETEVSAEGTVTVVLEEKLMLRPSETELLLTKNHTKMNSKNPDS